MAVKIQGEHRIEAPRESVWRAIVDPKVLARTLPGLEELKETGENRFEGTIQLKVGPVQGQFRGTVTLADLVPPESYRLHLKGEGAPGFVDGQGVLRLEAEGAATLIRYQVEAQVGGRIAGVGQRLLDSSARVLTRQALEGLERQVSAQLAASPSAGAAAAAPGPAVSGQDAPGGPAAPSQAEFAARFARGLAGELVPRERRPLLLLVALVVGVGLAALLVRACGG